MIDRGIELRKIQPRGNSYGICISRRELDQLRWLPGDFLAVEIEGETLVMRNLKSEAVRRRLAPTPRRARVQHQNPEE